MAIISLTQGKTAQVSDKRLDLISAYSWWAVYIRERWYACGWINGKTVRLHRFIMGVSDPTVGVDHIDGDGLNCLDENLRICTQKENCRNTKLRKKSTSGFKGVSWHKYRKKYQGKIGVDGKQVYLGLFDDPVECAKVYDEAAKKYFGDFANLNFSL